MYSFNYLEPIKNNINDKIFNERMRYEKIYDIIESYLSKYTNTKNYIILGGSSGITLLLNKKRTIQDFYYYLYTEHAFAHANNLINEIDSIINATELIYVIYLKNTIPNMKYQIVIDNRIFIDIYKLSINSYDLILPILTESFNKKNKILVLSPEMQLIDIYRTLYSPNKSDVWISTLDDESKLFTYLYSRIEKIKGGDTNINSEMNVNINDRKLIELELMKQFIVNNNNIVLIGEHALKIIIGTDISIPIIQIISQNNIEDDFVEIQKIIKNTLNRNIPVIKSTKDLHIMEDFRLKRTSIKIGDNLKEIMYIYNAADYDLIPFNKLSNQSNTDKKNKSLIKIGNPFVLLRFLLIDFWIVRWVKQIGGIDEKYAYNRLESIIHKLLLLRKKISDNTKLDNINNLYFDSHSHFNIFQSNSENYIGIYNDEIISQKILIKNLSKKFYDYYPIDYKNKNGFYREIKLSSNIE